MSNRRAPSAPMRAADPKSSARAEATRRNGAKSRGPKTPEGKARSAQNVLKHGLRAQKYVVLPDEDAAEFAALETALIEELAPVGALQAVLARRIAVAAWRLARAERIEAERFEERRFTDGGLGLALIRDGNGTRSFETLMRYRGAAMAEFWRALRTLKALQAEDAATIGAYAAPARRAKRRNLTPPVQISDRPRPRQVEPHGPNEPVREITAYVMPSEPEPRRTLHEAAARWRSPEPAAERNPDEPETRGIPGAAVVGTMRRNPSSAGAVGAADALRQIDEAPVHECKMVLR